MKWLILGALLGLLLLYPAALAAVLTIVAAVLAKPVIVVFGLGVAVGLRAARLRRWAR